jgi:CheY-like chemotaxis protein
MAPRCGTDWPLGRGVIRDRGWMQRVMPTSRARERDDPRTDAPTEPVVALARGVAHDFNNLLTVIRVHAEFLRDALAEGSDERADADGIIRATDQAAGLTARLLAFGRKRSLHPVMVDVGTATTELEPLLRRLIGGGVELATITPDEAASAPVDSGLLEQVLINLVLDARGAMGECGQITIETNTKAVDGSFDPVRRGLVAAGMYVVLAVSHKSTGARDGRGDRPSAQRGKAVPTGAGLGLTTVYEIVNAAGGCVIANDAGDAETTVRVFLPFAAGEEAAVRCSPVPRETRGRETVLLVEDETAVRGVARRVLEGHGYHVLVARHGADALRLAAEHQRPVHVLLTDLVTPELGGRELIERLRADWPDLAVVCMSGYTHAELGGGDLPAGAVFLPKPFGERDLVTAVRRTLDRANARRVTGI